MEIVGDAEGKSRVVGRVRIPWTGNRSSKETVDEIHLLRREREQTKSSSLRLSGKSYGTTAACE